MKATWKADALALGMIVAMFVLAALNWSTAPPQMAVHWTWDGVPDRIGGRFEGLLGLPLAAAGLYVVLRFLPRLDPRKRNYDAFTGPYAIIRTIVVGLLLGLYVAVLLSIRDQHARLNGLVAAEAGVALLLLGNYLPKVKSNWLVGVRTPWTLSSESSWRRTHRLAGWLFTIGGILTVAAALTVPDFSRPVLLGVLIAASATSIVYSYFAWKNDPQRIA